MAVLADSRLERVRLAAKVTFTLVVDQCGVAGAGLNGVALGQFNVWGTPDDTVDP